MPNLKGQTLAAIRKQAGIDYKIEVEPNYEDKDTAIVTQQKPDSSQYTRILKGQTITVQTQKKLKKRKLLLILPKRQRKTEASKRGH